MGFPRVAIVLGCVDVVFRDFLPAVLSADLELLLVTNDIVMIKVREPGCGRLNDAELDGSGITRPFQ